MQKCQIVAHVLVPPDQQSPETVHPTMCPFHHPPPCHVPCLMLDGLGFLAPCPDVGGEPKLGQQLPHLIIVLALVQTHPLRLRQRGHRPLDGDTGDGFLDYLEVMAVRAIHREADRPAAVGEHAPFSADLPAVGRMLTHLFPPQGRLWSSPHPMASHGQSIPCKALYVAKPCSHKARKTPAAAHSWKRRCTELLEQRPVSCSAFHWHPVRRTKKMAFMAQRSSTRGRWHPRGYGFRGGSNGWMYAHSSSGIRQSRRTFSPSSRMDQAPVTERFFPTGYPKKPIAIGS
jgi:hypothetical protein